jgi:tRNA A-37 threonylcarbamoyl transferase component Bud32
MIGTQAGNYEFVEKIGSGAMGVVYRGRHRVLHHDVALKVLREELAHEEIVAARFVREAQFGARLDHPAVVRVYDIVSEDGQPPFIVMQLVKGETLQHLIKRGPLPVEQAVHITQEILSALQAAHAENIVHRDIKPGNIFLGQDGKVKVGDFGIARAGGESGGTIVGAMVGAPHYLSPEQVEGKDAQTRSDLYSVGIVLYEMLAGHVPFRAETQLAVMHMQATSPPPPLPDSVPLRLREIVEKALAKKPEDRFESAAQFSEALRAPETLLAPDAKSVQGAAPPVKRKWTKGRNAQDKLPAIQNATVEVLGQGTAQAGSTPGTKAKGVSRSFNKNQWLGIAALVSGIAVILAGLVLWPRESVEKITEEVPLQFEITQQAAPKLPVGQKRVAVKGETGLRRTVYDVTYSANMLGRQEVKREAVDEQVVRQPKDEVVRIGTRKIETFVERRPIPFQKTTETVYDHPGETIIKRAGQDGEAEVTLRVESLCDLEGRPIKQISRKVISWKKIKDPQNEIVEVGKHRTKPKPKPKPNRPPSFGGRHNINGNSHSGGRGSNVGGVSQDGGGLGASE